MESVRKEKVELAQRLTAVKEAAKQSLQSSTKRWMLVVLITVSQANCIYASLGTLRTAVSELKTQSESCLSVAADARGSLADVQELRNTISEAMKSEPRCISCFRQFHVGHVGIQPYLEPNDKWAKSAVARDLMNDLELECSKSEC